MASEYQPDLIGLRAYLMTDPVLSEELEKLAKRVLTEAQRLAPVGEAPHDKTPGEYRDSLYMQKHISKSRMSFRIGSTSKKAWWIEYGTKHMPKFAVLRRALDSITRGAQSPSDYQGVAEYDASNAGSQRSRALNRAARARRAQLRKGA